MKTITLCGSGKHKLLIHTLCSRLQEDGFVVLCPPLHNIAKLCEATDKEGELLMWKGATFAHLNRIDTADICLMVNPAGYLGSSSTLELGYAVARSKLIISLRHDSEPAREALFHKILETEDPDLICEALSSIAAPVAGGKP